MTFEYVDRLRLIEARSSFSKAADELYISRSALLQYVNSLEQELGFKIFDRSSKGATPTRAGARFISDSLRLKGSYEDSVRECRRLNESVSDTITIGLMPNFKSPFLPQICREFRARRPNVEIRYQDVRTSEFKKAFGANLFDVAVEYFSAYINDIPGLRTQIVTIDVPMLEVPPGHPLAHLASIGPEDLVGHAILLYRRGITKDADWVRDYLRTRVPEVRIIDIEDYDSSLLMRCETEDAVVLSYRLYAQSFPQFVHVPARFEGLVIPLGFCYHKERRPVVDDFISVIRELYPEYAPRPA